MATGSPRGLPRGGLPGLWAEEEEAAVRAARKGGSQGQEEEVALLLSSNLSWLSPAGSQRATNKVLI